MFYIYSCVITWQYNYMRSNWHSVITGIMLCGQNGFILWHFVVYMQCKWDGQKLKYHNMLYATNFDHHLNPKFFSHSPAAFQPINSHSYYSQCTIALYTIKNSTGRAAWNTNVYTGFWIVLCIHLKINEEWLFCLVGCNHMHFALYCILRPVATIWYYEVLSQNVVMIDCLGRFCRSDEDM